MQTVTIRDGIKTTHCLGGRRERVTDKKIFKRVNFVGAMVYFILKKLSIHTVLFPDRIKPFQAIVFLAVPSGCSFCSVMSSQTNQIELARNLTEAASPKVYTQFTIC